VLKKQGKRRSARAKARKTAPSLRLQIEQLRVQAVEDRIRLEKLANAEASGSLVMVTQTLTLLRHGLERVSKSLDALRLRVDVLETELPMDAGQPATFTAVRRDGKQGPPAP
jgi:hypothetical protein